MVGFLKRIFGSDDVAQRDARLIYDTLMTQARDRRLYGEGRIQDTQEGRIEALVLHIAPVMGALSQLGDQGRLLSQAVFDTMKADFDTALREEGYSDSGVKRRIKPIIQRFYAGLDAYTKALDANEREALIVALSKDMDGVSKEYLGSMADYMAGFRAELAGMSLGEIARARFTYPSLPL